MMKSLYSGVAGMKTHNQRMDVIGNNISNVNTTGYKTSAVTFKDVYYQTKANASSGDATQGGKNPTQIGYGAQLGTVSQIMTQSGFTYSDSYYDCALQGEGFFQVMDNSGNIFYTRAGKFSIDSYGNLCDPNGMVVCGVSGDPSQVETGQTQRINIKVPAVDDNKASATKTVNGYDITISANSPGEQGNISFTVVNSDTPYATKSGSSLTIYMDLDQDFGHDALMEYQKKVLEAYPGEGADAVLTPLQEKYGENYAEMSGYYNEAYAALEDNIEKAAEDNLEFANLLSTAKTEYTQAALDDFEAKLNEAIDQGGVGLEDGVLPLDVSFDTLPPYSDVQALKAHNTIPLKTYNSNGDVTDEIALTFTCDKAGEFANKYEIDLKYSSTVGATPVAKWKDSTLTITLPNNLIPSEGEGEGAGTSLQLIQDAIDKAAKDKGDDYKLTVSLGTWTEKIEETGEDGNTVTRTVEHEYTDDDLKEFNFSSCLGNKTERLGLDEGRDNFFSDIATAMSTVSLADGRVAKEQAVDDLETLRIQSDGTIIGMHAVHGTLYLGRIDIATFENPVGLEQTGTSLWRASVASGPAQVKIAGSDGAGEVVSGALEMSNVDLAQEFSDMIITQRGYQANSRIITVSDTMLEELINLKR